MCSEDGTGDSNHKTITAGECYYYIKGVDWSGTTESAKRLGIVLLDAKGWADIPKEIETKKAHEPKKFCGLNKRR